MTSPIKGTYPRGSDALEEQALRRALVEDEKETAEHRMLVDLMRNDLGAISRPGSVHVQRYDVEAYATVQHLVSHVGATLTVDPPRPLLQCSRVVPSPAVPERWSAPPLTPLSTNHGASGADLWVGGTPTVIMEHGTS